jgi:ribosomal protein S18 acetylase RimI-like enzyme
LYDIGLAILSISHYNSAKENKLIPLSATQINDAARVLTRAFKNDSEVVYYFPNEADRENLLPLFQVELRYGLKYGEIYTTSPALEGIAIWLPPGETELSMWKMIKCGAWKLPFKMKPSFLYPYMNSVGNVLGGHHKNASFPHWYLMALCVDTRYQGQGFASKLLKPMLSRIDSEQLPCYLETTEEIYVPLYRHFGFEVIESIRIPGTPIIFRAMLREARK